MAYCNRSLLCINLNKISQLKSQVHVSVADDFKFGEALESVYPLLELIFNYLDFNDLQNVSLVKKTWQEIALKILEKRNKISWLTVFQKRRQISLHHNQNFCYNNAQSGIVLFNYRMISLSDKVCCHEHEHCLPKKLRFSDILVQHILPQGIKYCIVACSGVSSLFSNDNTIAVKSKTTIFDVCLLPPIPNVQVSMFYHTSNNHNNNCIKPNERIKCLLLFSKYSLQHGIYKILERLIPEDEWRHCAFGGGVIHRMILSHGHEHGKSESYKSANNLCITFTENKYIESSFDTASVVISGLTNSEFEQQLLTFKQRIMMRSQSFAIRICCSAKSKKSHESKIFNQLFPNTPLLGLDVEGEFGWDCTTLTNTDDNQTKKTKHGYPIPQHQWSTVIVFLTWGRILLDDHDL